MTTAKASLFRMLMVLAAAALAASLLILIAAGEPVQAVPAAKAKIAFASDRAGNMDIWVMNADGTGQTQLTRNEMGDGQPTWSPDGTEIAFLRVELPSLNREIYVMNADGAGERDLTNDPAFDFEPDWSPDGTQIAFSSDRGGEACAAAVYTISPDGTDIRKLTADSLEAFGAAWSPEGDKLAFSDHLCTGESDLFVMNADGMGVMQLFETRANETGATWSPDGKKVAFERFNLSRNGLVPNSGEIYVSAADGKGLTNLTNYPGADDEHPDWSPK